MKAAPRNPGEQSSPHAVWFDSSDVDWSPRFGEDRYADEQTLARFAIPRLAAPIVVLAAGSLGSTEILLRSRQLGLLATSARLGTAFSGNADGIGFGPISCRLAWPTELDLMARIARLELAERWGGWHRQPYTGRNQHVSVYRRA